MIKTWVLITIIFQLDGVVMMPPVEFPTMEACFKGRDIMKREMESEVSKAGINWQAVCIQKDLDLLIEGEKA